MQPVLLYKSDSTTVMQTVLYYTSDSTTVMQTVLYYKSDLKTVMQTVLYYKSDSRTVMRSVILPIYYKSDLKTVMQSVLNGYTICFIRSCISTRWSLNLFTTGNAICSLRVMQYVHYYSYTTCSLYVNAICSLWQSICSLRVMHSFCSLYALCCFRLFNMQSIILAMKSIQ